MLPLAAAGALVAKLSGEALAVRVGSAGQHEELVLTGHTGATQFAIGALAEQ